MHAQRTPWGKNSGREHRHKHPGLPVVGREQLSGIDLPQQGTQSPSSWKLGGLGTDSRLAE